MDEWYVQSTALPFNSWVWVGNCFWSNNYIEEKEIFECYEIKSSDIQSTGIQTSEGFVVLRGSKVREKATESAELSSQNYIRFRNQCFDDGTIVNGILNKDLFFSRVI